MKKRHLILVLLSSVFLVACQNNDQSAATQNKPTAKVMPKDQRKTLTKESSAKVLNKGSYHYIKGKYDDIIIVNKSYPLDKDYNPGENPQAKTAFKQLCQEMKSAGYALNDHYSGFRSYREQEGLYANYVSRDGQVNADRYSARPGYSEHQTGLAFDLIDAQGNLLEEPAASDWLLKHAPEFGFIVRYLPGKEASTGYQPESWHIRYIGKEAVEIANSGKTLEEYFGIKGGQYPQ